MKKIFFILIGFCTVAMANAQIGKVGINTTTPAALLHVKDSSVLFSGAANLPVTPGNPPASGAGVRMMWYPDKAAFRVGQVFSTNWDKDSIGDYSFASGYNTKAKGYSSTAIGYFTKATGDYSTAMGYLTEATGYSSTAIGYFTKATGDYSTAMGNSTNATGYSSTAMGHFTTATGNYSTAMGNSTVSRSYGSVTIGRYNDSINSSSPTLWVTTDPVFIIGNGTANNARSNALVVLKNAKTGINTSSPQAMLHVKDSSVLFSGATSLPGTPGNPPASGAGIRMMWYPDRAAFRAGRVSSTQWDKDSIGDFSFASGNNTKANGYVSNAMGYFTTASGTFSTAMGYFTTASGTFSTAMGESTTASGSSSTTMGESTTASGISSIAMGNSTVSRSYGSVTIGRYNDSISSSSPTLWVTTDPVFIIGNGTADNARSNALVVLKNAKTGINTSSPQAGLHIKGLDATSNSHIKLESNSSTNNALIFYGGDLIFQNNRVGGDFYFKDNTGAVILSLFSSGNMTIAGTLTQNSDARLKKNISPLQNSLQKIMKLGGYHYQWINPARSQNPQSGLLAQEVEQQMPELVKTDSEGIKSVNYNGLIPYLVEAVKELKKENELLKAEIQKLKK